jgi:hypothetical protein
MAVQPSLTRSFADRDLVEIFSHDVQKGNWTRSLTDWRSSGPPLPARMPEQCDRNALNWFEKVKGFDQRLSVSNALFVAGLVSSEYYPAYLRPCRDSVGGLSFRFVEMRLMTCPGIPQSAPSSFAEKASADRDNATLFT